MGRKRPIECKFRLSQSEFELMQKQLKQAQMNRNAYLVRLISGATIFPKEQLKELRLQYATMNRLLRGISTKPNQIVHPYWFGDAERKATCLWLKGLPQLTATNMVEPVVIQCKNGTDSPWHLNTLGLPAEERRRLRSKTFPGLAKAMAEQWGDAAQ